MKKLIPLFLMLFLCLPSFTSAQQFFGNTTVSAIDREISRGNYTDAIRMLVPLLRKAPNDYELRYKLATCYYEYGLQNKAIEELNYIIKLKPDYAPAHKKLGIILKKKGEKELAFRELNQAAELMPNDMDLKFEIAKIYLEKGDKVKTQEILKDILKADHSYFNASILMADLYTELKDYDNAIEELKFASLYSPKNPDIHFRLGKIYMLQGNKNSAIEEYRILKEIDSRMAQDLFVMLFP